MNIIKKTTYFIALFSLLLMSSLSFAENETITNSKENVTNSKLDPVIASQIFDKVKNNENWKVAFITGKHAQVVFMSINPHTNPKNEIGMETHKFDQVIFVAEGKATVILDGKISTVTSGDMVFIPQGTAHNFINLNKDKPFKILSVYSDTDIPANATYEKKSDTKED